MFLTFFYKHAKLNRFVSVTLHFFLHSLRCARLVCYIKLLFCISDIVGWYCYEACIETTRRTRLRPKTRVTFGRPTGWYKLVNMNYVLTVLERFSQLHAYNNFVNTLLQLNSINNSNSITKITDNDRWHRARGHATPLLQMAGHRGSMSRRTANKKLTNCTDHHQSAQENDWLYM